jgi:hypothetical protein
MSKRQVLLMLIAFGLLLGCFEQEFENVSGKPEFKKMLGTRYEIIGPVDAYGIRKRANSEVHYVTLIPPPGIEGYEVGFRVPVVVGSKITILSVLKSNRWPDPDMTLLVQLEGVSLPINTSVRLDLYRGNEGKGRLQLNPSIYRRIEQRN